MLNNLSYYFYFIKYMRDLSIYSLLEISIISTKPIRILGKTDALLVLILMSNLKLISQTVFASNVESWLNKRLGATPKGGSVLN